MKHKKADYIRNILGIITEAAYFQLQSTEFQRSPSEEKALTRYWGLQTNPLKVFNWTDARCVLHFYSNKVLNNELSGL